MQLLIESVPGALVTGASFVVGLSAGTAYGPLRERSGSVTAVRMQNAFSAADGATNWRVWRWLQRTFFSSTTPRSSESDPLANAAVGAVVIFALVRLFAQHHTLVATIIVMATLIMAVAVTATFAGLWWNEVVDARDTAIRLLMSLVLVAVGVYDGVSLEHPAFNANAVTDLLAHGVLGAGADSFGTVLYQAIGACIALAVMVVAIAYCFASTTAVYIAMRATGRPLWRLIYWATRWTTPQWFWWLTVLLGFVSLGLTNGFIVHLIGELHRN